jgi:hypothetical protein
VTASTGTGLDARQVKRVPARLVSAALDEIRDLLGMDFSHALYRYVSSKTGIHPTTLLRYHRGRLESAPAELALFLQRLQEQIAHGRRPVLEGRLRRRRCTSKKTPQRRVRNSKVRRLFQELVERLQVPPNMLYRQVGAAVGLHPITVFRHASGQLATAPERLLDHLSEMIRTLEQEGEVVFTRARRGTHVVPRQLVAREIRRLLLMKVFPSKRSLLRLVEAGLGVKPRSLERAFSSKRGNGLVDVAVLRFLKELVARLEYAPEAHYRVGDQIYHPLFGRGVVVAKQPKGKVAVEFADGTRQVLREGLLELREWNRRESWLDNALSVGEAGQ